MSSRLNPDIDTDIYLMLKKSLHNKCVDFYYKEYTVQKEHIDHYDHVNNLVYLQWFLQIAQSHSEHLGYGKEHFKKLGAAFFVRKHEITYHHAAYLNDSLVLATWCGNMKAGSAYRYYELYRINTPSQNQSPLNEPLKKITSGSTQWAFVNLKTKEPTFIPEEIKNAFHNQNLS